MGGSLSGRGWSGGDGEEALVASSALTAPLLWPVAPDAQQRVIIILTRHVSSASLQEVCKLESL